ncbi:BolA family transcriptional regulator, general stress-responsive regulator [Nematocida major]|uniref:BolA family transcriptional regulator, general stress-responsive regulator n=1 Tax=Nematocida major TaxID=1912982 RepID=UPI0020075BF4|nr:BolA family transcriptional regulator, general stress-responsive regulator [Nematocida major]KAH9385391.1 BolA family transcriptional regulator, general stress-responsive regulator [Nematocida major]
MPRIERIEKFIREKYPNASIRITDKTKEHLGHKEILSLDNPQETHLDIKVWDESFKGSRPIDSIREINKAIKGEFEQGLHAVTIDCSQPDAPEQ